MRAAMVMAPANVAAMELVRMSAILHMAEFMRKHAFKLLIVQQVPESPA